MSAPSRHQREERQAPTASAARVGLGRFDRVAAHERTDAVPPAASPTTPKAFLQIAAAVLLEGGDLLCHVTAGGGCDHTDCADGHGHGAFLPARQAASDDNAGSQGKLRRGPLLVHP